MRSPPLLLVVASLALLACIATPQSRATETDQFTLPPRPLDDLGPDFGALVLGILRTEVAQFNAGVDARAQLNPKAATEPVKDGGRGARLRAAGGDLG